MADSAVFPLEILEKIAQANDDDYSAQAAMCLVSRALFKFTQPRLYRSFNSILAPSPTAYLTYLRQIGGSEHLARLVKSCCFIALDQDWPRDISSALLSMPNLKELTLIGHQPQGGTNMYQDIWRDMFQSYNIPFKLDILKLFMQGSDRSIHFESLALSLFLKSQTSLHTFHCYFQTALLGPTDLPNLRNLSIDPRNWEFVLPDRTIQSLALEGTIQDAQSHFKPVLPGSPIANTLGHIKRLRIDAEILDVYLLCSFLQSLEYLIVLRFSEDKHRGPITMLPQLKVICIPESRKPPHKRKEIANWFFDNIDSLTDVVFSGPFGSNGRKEDLCERYSRSTRKAETILRADWYQKLVGHE